MLKRDLIPSERAAQDKLVSTFDVSRETLDALSRYQDLLTKWANQINLVGPSTIGHFWERHVLDCAQILPVAGPTALQYADFGSGAGLPGLVLASLLKDRGQGSHVTMIEASSKRCGFLREAARALGVDVTIHHEKIEDSMPVRVDVVTARAFAPLEKLLGYAQPWAKLGARIIFLKGEDVQREIDQASTNWAFQSKVSTSLTDSRGCVLEIFDLQQL